MQLAEGFFQFKVPMPVNPNIPDGGLLYTLVYAVETSEGWVVIDAGTDTDEGFEAFQGQLSEAGIAPQDIAMLVITHGHYDHVGLANRIKGLTGARLAMHRLDATDPSVLTFQPGAEPPEVDVFPQGGEELVADSGLWTVWTPGHTPGHLCIYDRKRRLLFTGDHLLPVITPGIGYFPGSSEDPLGNFLQSQLAIKDLDVDMVHPAHQHSFPNLSLRVQEMLEHHRRRTDEILAQVQDGPKTAVQVAAGVTWAVGPWQQFDLGTRRAALTETLAHLQHLVLEGKLLRQERGYPDLVEELRHLANPGKESSVALVGVGRLGKATLTDPNLAAEGIRIVAAFDADPRLVGQVVGDLTIQPMGLLKAHLMALGVRSAVVAVPPRQAQGVIDRLVECGVQAILSYALVAVKAPPHVKLRTVEAVAAMQSTTLYLPPP